LLRPFATLGCGAFNGNTLRSWVVFYLFVGTECNSAPTGIVGIVLNVSGTDCKSAPSGAG